MAVRQLKKTGKWMATCYRGYEQQADGTLKKLAHAKCFDTKKAAQAWERTQQNALDQGSWVPPSRKTLGEFLSEWEASGLALGEQRERTRESYSELLRLYVRPHLSGVRLAALTKLAVQGMAAKLLAQPITSGGKAVVPKEDEPVPTLNPKTVRRALVALSIALNAAVEQQLLKSNPAQGVSLPRAARKRIVWLDREQVSALIAGTEDDRHGALWHLLAHAGLRPGEALGLAWQHLDLEGGVIHVMRAIGRKKKDAAGRTWRLDDPKTERGRRTVPMDAKLVQALLRHRDRQAAERLVAGERYRSYDLGGFVFASEIGEPLRADVLLQVLQRTLTRLGLPKVTLYSLRHGFGSLMLEAGAPLKVVSTWMGHASVQFTMDVYMDVTDQFQRQALDQFSAYMALAPAREREA